MKREGRQHGMVRTYRVLPTPLSPNPETRFATRFDSQTTAGPFARVSARPNNHSKFTGKCGGCHVIPASKARDKGKGTQKTRSYDVVSNYRMVTWRVVDARPGLSFSGSSATVILGQLCDGYRDDRDYYDDDHDHRDDDDVEEEEVDPTVDDGVEEINGGDHGVEEINGGDHGFDDVAGGEEMSFCDVGFVLEQVEGDDGWCLVAEM